MPDLHRYARPYAHAAALRAKRCRPAGIAAPAPHGVPAAKRRRLAAADFPPARLAQRCDAAVLAIVDGKNGSALFFAGGVIGRRGGCVWPRRFPSTITACFLLNEPWQNVLMLP